MNGRDGRGWGGAAALALAATLSSVVHPVLLILAPFALLLLALPPRRPLALAAGALLLVFMLSGGAADPFWVAQRGWVLVAAAWFVLAVVAWPAAPFLSRALAAVGAAAGSAAAVLLIARGGWSTLDWEVAQRLRAAAAQIAAFWTASGMADSPAAASRVLYRWADLNAWLYPALVGLSTVAGLGAAWWLFRRLFGAEGRTLGRLRDFRFRDELVWLLIAGIVLVVAARTFWGATMGGGGEEEAALRAGSNLVLFMGVLYALRGAGVLLTLAAGVGPGAALLWLFAVVLLYPVAVVTAVLVGLTDTWVDLRARRRAATPGA